MESLTGFIRLPTVKQLTGLSRSTVYRLEADGRFPARLRISKRVTGWRPDEIQAWIDSRQRVSQHEQAA